MSSVAVGLRSKKTTTGQVHCLLCNDEMKEHSPLEQILCECLCRLFSLEIIKSVSFAIQDFCSVCNGKIRHIHGLYRELERLETEIGMNCSQFIASIKSQGLDLDDGSVVDAKRCLLTDIIQGNNCKFHAGSQPIVSEAFSLIEPKEEVLDLDFLDVPDGLEESDACSNANVADDALEPGPTLASDSDPLATGSAKINLSKFLKPIRRSMRLTRRVNYSNNSQPPQEKNPNSQHEDVDADPDFEVEMSANDSGSDDEYIAEPSSTKRSKTSSKPSEPKPRIPCLHCSREFRYRKELVHHLECHLPDAERSHVCSTCGKGFPKASMLFGHQQTHRKKFKQHGSKKRRPKIKMPEKRMNCPEPGCGFKCKYINELRAHVANLHNKSEHIETLNWLPQKPKRRPSAIIECKECGKNFRSAYFKSHVQTHKPDNERKHQCSICGKGFSTASKLGRHALKHHGEESGSAFSKILCSVCGKSVINIKAHMWTHGAMSGFPCSLCPKSFRYKKELETHELKHSGVRPYSCDLCPKAFHSQYVMNSHRRSIHVEEKKFLCAVCGKAFRNNGNYLNHQRVHMEKEKPHKCNFCGKSFHLMDELIEHKNEIHPDGAGAKRNDRESFAKEVVHYYENMSGLDKLACAKHFAAQGKSKSTIYRILSRYTKWGTAEYRKIPGRPTVISAPDNVALVKAVYSNPNTSIRAAAKILGMKPSTVHEIIRKATRADEEHTEIVTETDRQAVEMFRASEKRTRRPPSFFSPRGGGGG